MASLISFTPSTTRIFAATATKSAGGGKEEKGFLDFILGKLTKEDQFYETDPILQKVEEEKSSSRGTTSSKGTTSIRKNTVAVPPKKKGGFGGLFAKN